MITSTNPLVILLEESHTDIKEYHSPPSVTPHEGGTHEDRNNNVNIVDLHNSKLNIKKKLHECP